MGLIFTPSSLTFRSLVGNSSTKSVELSSEGFLFNGFTSTPGRSFTVTDAVIKHLHNGVVFTEGVSYYVQPNGSVSETLSTCLIGIGNSAGGLNLTFKRLLIDSLNNGLPFYFIGEFTEGVHYFFTNDGRIVPASDPDITTWCVGLGDENNDLILYSGQVMITSPLSGDVYETICNIPISYLHQNEATNINVYTSINGGIETLFESEAPVSAVYTLDTTLLSLTDGDTLKIIIKNSDNEFHKTEITLNIIETIIEITSIEEYDE